MLLRRVRQQQALSGGCVETAVRVELPEFPLSTDDLSVNLNLIIHDSFPFIPAPHPSRYLRHSRSTLCSISCEAQRRSSTDGTDSNWKCDKPDMTTSAPIRQQRNDRQFSP